MSSNGDGKATVDLAESNGNLSLAICLTSHASWLPIDVDGLAASHMQLTLSSTFPFLRWVF